MKFTLTKQRFVKNWDRAWFMNKCKRKNCEKDLAVHSDKRLHFIKQKVVSKGTSKLGMICRYTFFYKKSTFFLSLNFLNFSPNWGWDFLNFCWNKLAETGYPVFIETAFYYLQCFAWFFRYFVIQCLICLIHDYQRKVSIFEWELA